MVSPAEGTPTTAPAAAAIDFGADDLRGQLDKAFGTLGNATFKDAIAAFGTGENLAALKEQLEKIKGLTEFEKLDKLKEDYRALVTLGIDALSAGPFAVIGLIVITLGLAAAITSIIGGVLYAAGSAVGLAAAIAAAEGNDQGECGDGGGDGEDNNIDEIAPFRSGGDGEQGKGKLQEKVQVDAEPKGSAKAKGKKVDAEKEKQRKKDRCKVYNEKQKWMADIEEVSKETSKYLLPWVMNGLNDDLLNVAESVLVSATEASKRLAQAA